MSYDMHFEVEPGKTYELPEPLDLRGGTYAAGGTTEAWLNITYNYGEHFYAALGDGGLRSLYGRRANEIREILPPAISQLGTEQHSDYWTATPGNAGHALQNLLTLACAVPDHAILRGD